MAFPGALDVEISNEYGPKDDKKQEEGRIPVNGDLFGVLSNTGESIYDFGDDNE